MDRARPSKPKARNDHQQATADAHERMRLETSGTLATLTFQANDPQSKVATSKRNAIPVSGNT